MPTPSCVLLRSPSAALGCELTFYPCALQSVPSNCSQTVKIGDVATIHYTVSRPGLSP